MRKGNPEMIEQRLDLGATAGDSVSLGALGVRFMLRSEQTGGGFSLVEHPLEAGFLGAPLHTHRLEDEYSYVAEGEVGFLIGDRELVASTGTLVSKPRYVPHSFWNPGSTPARILEIISPGGFERYFEEIAQIFGTGAAPDMERMGEVLGRYQLDLDMSSVPTLTRRFGVRSDIGSRA